MSIQAAFACVCAGFVLITIACVLIQHERKARAYDRLVEAAGSEELAELVISDTAALKAQRDAATDALMRRGFACLHRNNIVHLVPRYRGGRIVPFTPGGDAA